MHETTTCHTWYHPPGAAGPVFPARSLTDAGPALDPDRHAWHGPTMSKRSTAQDDIDLAALEVYEAWLKCDDVAKAASLIILAVRAQTHASPDGSYDIMAAAQTLAAQP